MSPLNRFVSLFHGDSTNSGTLKKKEKIPKKYTSDLNIYGSDAEKIKKHYIWSSIRGPKKHKGL